MNESEPVRPLDRIAAAHDALRGLTAVVTADDRGADAVEYAIVRIFARWEEAEAHVLERGEPFCDTLDLLDALLLVAEHS